MYSESVYGPNVFTDLKDQCSAAKESRVIVVQFSEGQFFTKIIAENNQNIKSLKTIA